MTTFQAGVLCLILAWMLIHLRLLTQRVNEQDEEIENTKTSIEVVRLIYQQEIEEIKNAKK